MCSYKNWNVISHISLSCPVKSRKELKILLLAYKELHGQAPGTMVLNSELCLISDFVCSVCLGGRLH